MKKLAILGCIMIILGCLLQKIDNEKRIYCIRKIVGEDEIECGCDKYFTNDKWYKDYMKYINEEYNKIK